jgi:segregation and condensation protein B
MDFDPLIPPVNDLPLDRSDTAVEWSRAFMRRGTRRAADPRDLMKTRGSEARTRDEKLARLEAALFVAPEALSTRKLAQFALLADVAETRTLIDRLNEEYDRAGSTFRAERVATGYRLLTRPVFARWLNRLHRRQSQLQLSPPAMETLTIIAYRQPIKRVDVEAVRGVQSAEMIKQLMERGLVRIAGEEDTLGRPYLYGTTRQFLETFGLRTLDDLPRAKELRAQPASEQEEADAAEPRDTAA